MAKNWEAYSARQINGVTWRLCYEKGLRPPRYSMPIPFYDYQLTPLKWGYWWLYWYRMGFNPPMRFRRGVK